MARLIIIIDPTSQEITYEVEGITDSRCTDITNAMARGAEFIEQHYKSEFWNTALVQQEDT